MRLEDIKVGDRLWCDVVPAQYEVLSQVVRVVFLVGGMVVVRFEVEPELLLALDAQHKIPELQVFPDSLRSLRGEG